jgi:hypothetical protein
MPYDFEQIQASFDNIINQRIELSENRQLLEQKLDQMKAQYTDLVKNNPKKIYLYCLDALFFQYKMLRVEMEQYSKMITLIYNRMYGEYYKLFTIIHTQCKEDDITVDYKMPVYKDLELNVEYELDDVIMVHRIILNLLKQLHNLYTSKQRDIDSRNARMCVGYSITGFIATLAHENMVINQNINLYSEYLTFYHSSQLEYISKLSSKMKRFMFDIDSEILVNHVTSTKPNLEQDVSRYNELDKMTNLTIVPNDVLIIESEPVKEPESNLIQESAKEPESNLIQESAKEPESNLIQEFAKEPESNLIQEFAKEPESNTILESESNTILEPTKEPEPDTILQPESNTILEPEPKPMKEPETESVKEPEHIDKLSPKHKGKGKNKK